MRLSDIGIACRNQAGIHPRDAAGAFPYKPSGLLWICFVVRPRSPSDKKMNRLEKATKQQYFPVIFVKSGGPSASNDRVIRMSASLHDLERH